MGIWSSMWTGVTGLLATSEKMSVIGNNLANVNTVGYKTQNTLFEDMISQNVSTGAGTGQIGLGVRVAAIRNDMSQGSLQTTTSSTDLAIGGNGFFIVRAPNTSTDYYTRAGSFLFNKDGQLVDSNNDVVQGWKVDTNRVQQLEAQNQPISQVPIEGALGDVQMSQFTLKARPTSLLTMIANLDSTATSASPNATNPLFGLEQNYHYTSNSSSAIAGTAFDYSSSLKVYDQNGATHTATIYYDKVSNSGGKAYWDFIVTVPGSDDGRTIGGVKMSSTSQAGLLMTGTLTFDASGDLINESAYTLQSNATPTTGANGSSFALSQWTAAKVSNGYPLCTANFKQVSGASGTKSTNAVSFGVNLGLSNLNGWQAGAASNAQAAQDYYWANPTNKFGAIQGFNPATTVTGNNVTTNYATSSSTTYASQDGYAPGLLQSVSVDTNGVLSGTFSNGQNQQLFVIGLANFTNQWGLRREGNNLFSATLNSGQALTNRPNTGGLGSISSDTLEQSNVDMATQLVDMITTQRAFEGDSKVITTADTLISELIQLKR
ncbi:MAG: flagellar hook protein FlgE [Desulfovibrionaceae bacterium]|nr:flagellar hook protein FlgE [Desulfovibrionaceae bacterium]MBF0514031.1 flagellar hook protein FlgE [Desulfovibrionaceae bacterium]